MPSIPPAALNNLEDNAIRVLLTGFGVSFFLGISYGRATLTDKMRLAICSFQGEPFLACSQTSSQQNPSLQPTRGPNHSE